ncbi:MAG: acyl-CoA thioesterase [Bacteroidia bacterium]|jgi:acyl-CoA thioester hydrolase
MPKSISHTTKITVRFSECDALKMVWHGNYVKYFEDGREDFGKAYELEYMDIYRKTGLAVPLVHLECDFKKMVGIGETIYVETTLVDSPAAKIIFNYTIYNEQKEVVCKGNSVQVFLHTEKKELLITVPPFFEDWKSKYLK